MSVHSQYCPRVVEAGFHPPLQTFFWTMSKLRISVSMKKTPEISRLAHFSQACCCV